jgi:hypothetical protein
MVIHVIRRFADVTIVFNANKNVKVCRELLSYTAKKHQWHKCLLLIVIAEKIIVNHISANTGKTDIKYSCKNPPYWIFMDI